MRRKSITWGLGCLGVGILLVPALWKLSPEVKRSRIFSLREIEVRGCERLTPEAVRSLSGVHDGENLFDLDSEGISRRLEHHVTISNASVAKAYPNKLRIRIEERKPRALVQIQDRLYYMDRQGTVLNPVGPGDPLDLPIVTGLENRKWKFGGPDQGNMVQGALQLLDELDAGSMPSRVSEVHVDPVEGMSLFLEAFPVEIRVGWDGFRSRADLLVKALPRLVADPDGVLSVDLRFKDQVVVKRRATAPKRMSVRKGILFVPNA